MEKDFYMSKTFWGAVLIAIESGLLTLPGSWPYVEVLIVAMGAFLTIFGFRSAMK